jgi:AcrR family transcriptional regulator
VPPRPLRADARRNRDKLLEVAVLAFSADPAVPLEKIAKEAGVGIGTLYRHFPTREALVEAAYRNELTKLCEAAPVLLADLPPLAALRGWMDLFYGYIATKQGLAAALRSVIDAGGNPFAVSRNALIGALSLLLDGARDDLREELPDSEPLALDLLVALSAIGSASADRDQADRLLDLLVAGLSRH